MRCPAGTHQTTFPLEPHNNRCADTLDKYRTASQLAVNVQGVEP